jgi:hypothetical protein
VCIAQIVASGLLSKQAVVMSYEHGNFRTLEELAVCMRASMLLPGVTGEITRLKVRYCFIITIIHHLIGYFILVIVLTVILNIMNRENKLMVQTYFVRGGASTSHVGVAA